VPNFLAAELLRKNTSCCCGPNKEPQGAATPNAHVNENSLKDRPAHRGSSQNNNTATRARKARPARVRRVVVPRCPSKGHETASAPRAMPIAPITAGTSTCPERHDAVVTPCATAGTSACPEHHDAVVAHCEAETPRTACPSAPPQLSTEESAALTCCVLKLCERENAPNTPTVNEVPVAGDPALLSALRKLPPTKKSVLFRGTRDRVDMAAYTPGSTVTWRECSLATTTLAAATSKLQQTSEGTLFVIRDAVGYDVAPFSFFPVGNEVLLEPELLFKVERVLELPDGMKIIELTHIPYV